MFIGHLYISFSEVSVPPLLLFIGLLVVLLMNCGFEKYILDTSLSSDICSAVFYKTVT